MTVAITVYLFQAVYNGHDYFGRFWKIATYIAAMVNGHYIHFYNNIYIILYFIIFLLYFYKLTPILLNIYFGYPCNKVWVNGTTCFVTVKCWMRLIPIKISKKFNYSYPTYFAVAASHPELKPTRTFPNGNAWKV